MTVSIFQVNSLQRCPKTVFWIHKVTDSFLEEQFNRGDLSSAYNPFWQCKTRLAVTPVNMTSLLCSLEAALSHTVFYILHRHKAFLNTVWHLRWALRCCILAEDHRRRCKMKCVIHKVLDKGGWTQGKYCDSHQNKCQQWRPLWLCVSLNDSRKRLVKWLWRTLKSLLSSRWLARP